MTSTKFTATGTILAPCFYEGPAEVLGDVHLSQRFFVYKTDTGKVAGKTLNVMFTVGRSAKDVWPHLKDFNPWQNSYGHYYSGVLGDLEGKTFVLSDRSGEPGQYLYNVLRVIPEHLIVLSEPLPEESRAAGMSPDCHVFMLNEHGGKTVVTCLMEHASFIRDVITDEEALRPWRDAAPESHRKWRDIFVPTLKKLICQSR
jgi:hypothetical protein